jgi:[acyl-carrier-protein] S-malonyltransferase
LAEDSISFIFPAFTSDYHDDNSGSIPEFRAVFQSHLEAAVNYGLLELQAFHPESNPLLEDEMLNQYMSYIYGCSCARVLMDKGVKPVMMAGYSMGIYAALYASGSISFETGLLFIQKAYEAIRNTLPHNRYGMCGVIGLSKKDIAEIVSDHDLNLLIVNCNSEFSFILAGDGFHINVFVLKAREEGALHARSLGVTIPYHTSLLASAAAEFAKTVFIADVHSPGIPLISVLGQYTIDDAGRIKKEVVKNIHTPFNWLATQQKMFLSGVSLFTECGPSMALYKNSKFIQGSGKFVRWSSLL